MHEAFALTRTQPVEHLFFARGAKCYHTEHLRLSTCKEGRAMRAGQETDFTGDRADGFQVTAIGTYAPIKDAVAHVGLEFLLVESHNFFQAIWILYAQALHQFFLYHAQCS